MQAVNNKVAITLPLDEEWLGYVELSMKQYAEHAQFSQKLSDMLTSSVMEACEELIRIGKQAELDTPFELVMDFKGDAVVVELHYDAHIPLNPHQTQQYEVPDKQEDLDAIDLDALWLFLIKKRMDRVHFSIRGQSHVLSMIKYQRNEGREKQAWVMARIPTLKKGLILHLDDPKAKHPSSVLQSVGSGALKLGRSETFFVRNFDGKKSFHDLYMQHIDAIGMVSPNALSELYKALEASGMLASDDDMNKDKVNPIKAFFSKLINLDISIPNADAFVTKMHNYTKIFFSPMGLGMLLLLGLSGLIPLWQEGAYFKQALISIEQTLLNHPIIILPVYILSLVHIMLHEIGHGVTCKHYGGQVPRLGIMFYLSTFIFYCDTTASWNFKNKWARILVSLGGPIVSFAILGIGLWVSAWTTPNTLWQSIMLLFCLSTLFGLIMNFNPFIKMDAYYMLLDITEIANLRKKSFDFLEHKLLSKFGFGSQQVLATTPREERIFWSYGVGGLIFTTAFILLPLFRLGHMLIAESTSGGKLILLALIIVLIIARLTNLAVNKYKNMRDRNYSLQ